MCGIAGFWAPRRPLATELLVNMNVALDHRGPDDHGYLALRLPDLEDALPRVTRTVDPQARVNLGLAHRRLSIIDVSEAGQQPMSSRDCSIWLDFNGEVYNYIELRRELESLGHVFRTATDSEVIIAAYRAWGSQCFQRFTGMFAIALVDLSRQRLLLARDHFGIKPLYYHFDSDKLVFASEVKALMVLPELRKVNAQIAFDYLAYSQVDHAEETFIEGIRQVPAGHVLELDMKAQRPEFAATRYWQVDLDRRIDATPEEAAKAFKRLFMESMSLHLRSDVPLGSCLSGGLDSSSIVCALADLLGDDADLHTFTYDAGEPGIDETRYADLVNTRTGATSHRIAPKPEELVADVQRIIRVQDYPFGSTSIYAQSRVFQLAASHGMKVMLDGQGADELMAGYHSYLGAFLAQSVAKGSLLTAGRVANRALASGVPAKLLMLASGAHLIPASLHSIARRVVGEPIVPDWLDKRWVHANVESVVQTRSGVRDRRRALREYMLHQLTVSSLPALLRYEDRNSMSYSIESRVPFLVPAIAEFLFSLPDREVLDGTVTKPIMRRAMRGMVPDEILDRRDKIGFSTPERQWLTGPLEGYVREVLTSDAAAAVPVLKSPAMIAAYDRMRSGSERWNFRLWRWINLIEWTRASGAIWSP